MGYSYIGSCLVYGVVLEENEWENEWHDLEILENTDGVEYVKEINFDDKLVDTDHPLNKIYLKLFGFEEEYKRCICFGRLFKGGEFWKYNEYIDLDYMSKLELKSDEIQEKIDKICEMNDLKKRKVRWLNIIIAQ
jgi:hypothetical protein